MERRIDQPQQQNLELQRLPSGLYTAQHKLHENYLIAINAGGKGTQFEMMEKHFAQDPSIEFRVEGIGNYCRGVISYVKNPDEHAHFGKYAEHIEPHLPKMAKGELLPDANIISVVRLAHADHVGHIYNTGAERQFVLGLDGWPRTIEQYAEAERIKGQLAGRGIETHRSWMYMELPDHVVIDRTWNRVVQAMLNGQVLPEDYSQLAESVQRRLVIENFDRAVEMGVRGLRRDDRPETVPARIEAFKRETLPVVNRAAKDYGIKVINGDQDRDKVHADIKPNLIPVIAA